MVEGTERAGCELVATAKAPIVGRVFGPKKTTLTRRMQRYLTTIIDGPEGI